MTILSLSIGKLGQDGINPRRNQMVSTDDYSAITAAGYLNPNAIKPDVIYATDIFDIIYSFNAVTRQGVYVQMVPSISTAGIITLNPVSVAALNVIAGSNGVAGYLVSYPATLNKGYFEFEATANTGNTSTTLTNSAMGQASVIHISDPAAANGYLNTSTIDASLTPIGAFITKDVALTAAALATAGTVTIQASSGSMRFKVRDIKMNYSASGLSGGGGDRLVQITDGTTVYNNAGITAALLGTPVNTVWGGSGNPVPGTVALNTSSAAGAAIVAKYAGGTTDFSTGTVNITVALERVA